jgi:hypothetical protein
MFSKKILTSYIIIIGPSLDPIHEYARLPHEVIVTQEGKLEVKYI